MKPPYRKRAPLKDRREISKLSMRKLRARRKTKEPLVLPSVSVSFERFDWQVIYNALKMKADNLYERRFHAGGGYPRDIVERELEYLHSDLMPRVYKLFKVFDQQQKPPRFPHF